MIGSVRKLINDEEKVNKSIRSQPWWIRFQIYLIGFVIAVFVFFAVALALPYEPFKFYGWRAIPDTVCPFETLNTFYVSEVVAGPYTIGGMEGEATVVNEDGRTVDAWPVSIKDLEPHEKEIKRSDVARSAPLNPGVYRFGLTDIHIPGRMLYVVPDHQEFQARSSKSFEVLPLSDSRCENSILTESGGRK